MDSAIRSFEKRQRKLRRKHVRMSRGYVNKLDRNGVIQQKPDNKVIPLAVKLLVLSALAFQGFKALTLAGLGEARYLDTVSHLEAGTVYERLGAWAMQIDPVTRFLGAQIAPYLS